MRTPTRFPRTGGQKAVAIVAVVLVVLGLLARLFSRATGIGPWW